MRKIFGRLGCFLFLLIWAAVMIFPFVSFNLARNGEMTVGNSRIYLVTEDGSAGVGMQSIRESEPAGCQQTRVRFLLWEGEAQNAFSCYCEDGIEREPIGRMCTESN